MTQRHSEESKKSNLLLTQSAPETESAAAEGLDGGLQNQPYDVQMKSLQPVQCKDGGGEDSAAVQHAAAQGTSGGGQSIPYQQEMESSFGQSFKGVNAHFGSAAQDACQSMGAKAFATGNNVAFSESSPSKELVAHELTHVVQQSGGVQLKSGVGQVGDAYEQEADAVGAKVARGESVQSMLSGYGDVKGLSNSGPVQRYVEDYPTKGNTDNLHRISDDGSMAVDQLSAYGSKIAYADSSLISQASQKLSSANSAMKLEAGKFTITIDDPQSYRFIVVKADADQSETKGVDGKVHSGPSALEDARKVEAAGKGLQIRWAPGAKPKQKTLPDVVVTNTSNNTKDQDMELWADCGRSSRVVTGTDGGSGQGGGNQNASFVNKDGNEQTLSKHGGAIQKVVIYLDHFWKDLPKQVKSDINATYKQWQKTRSDYIASRSDTSEKGKAKSKAIRRRMSGLEKRLDELARHAYDQLDDNGKNEFDKKAKINDYADPEVGESFHIHTGGPTHPKLGKGEKTWNFHWAGVVMKTAGDSMTLENYATGDYNDKNTEWVYQMYGVGKKGQSFHHEHKEVHKQHGTDPTTMTMKHNT